MKNKKSPKVKKDSLKKRQSLGKTKVLYGGVLFDKKEREAIDKILDSNWWGIAKECQLFEEEAANVQGVRRAVFANSGTSALDMGIRALKLPKGSEVIVPACSFPTPIASIIREGLIPVVCDVDLGSYFISPESFKNSITDKTSAIFLVYVAGAVGWLGEVLDIAMKNNLKIIEDNCDGFGGTWMGKMIGSFGDFSAISTHAAHIISTGEGGILFTNDISLADRAKSLRDWGRIPDYETRDNSTDVFPPEYRRYIYSELGSNYKPLELQAAMGRVQLGRLTEFKKKRIKNFEVLRSKLAPYSEKIVMPESHPGAEACWYTFPITLNGVSRTKVISKLEKNGIDWRPILAGNIASQPVFKNQVVVRTELKNASRLISDSFWVPVHPQHSPSVMEYVADTIIQAIN